MITILLEKMNWLKENWFKVGIIIAALILAYSIYYSLVLLPQQRASKEALDRALNQTNLDYCLAEADDLYTTNWANACKSYAKIVEEGYKNCVATSDTSICRSVWKTPDLSPDCSLPSARADTVNKYHEDAKNECFRKYPID